MRKRHLRAHAPRFTVNRTLLTVGLMIFFFVIFDGVLMYLAPIVITGAGISESLMGLIIGSSSIAGFAFDFVLTRVVREAHYRRMFLLMLLLGALYPLFLFGGTTVTFYLVAMAVWGFYYDFYNMGTLDFVERTADPTHHASNFGSLRAFEGLGYLLAPFIGSLLLLRFQPGPRMLLALAVPLVLSFLFYLAIATRPASGEDGTSGMDRRDATGFLTEMRLWRTIGTILLPALALTLTINMIDSAVWTFGPLFSEEFGRASGMPGGVFMIAYALPPILVGWLVGLITRTYGTKTIALAAVGGGSVILVSVGLTRMPIVLIGLIFMASFCFAIGWPTINAVYTEYIERIPGYRKETETLQDMFTNFGDTIGPILGGSMAQYLGYAHTFVALGAVGAAIAAVLMISEMRRGARV